MVATLRKTQLSLFYLAAYLLPNSLTATQSFSESLTTTPELENRAAT
jgi:hypothetical protein